MSKGEREEFLEESENVAGDVEDLTAKAIEYAAQQVRGMKKRLLKTRKHFEAEEARRAEVVAVIDAAKAYFNGVPDSEMAPNKKQVLLITSLCVAIEKAMAYCDGQTSEYAKHSHKQRLSKYGPLKETLSAMLNELKRDQPRPQDGKTNAAAAWGVVKALAFKLAWWTFVNISMYSTLFDVGFATNDAVRNLMRRNLSLMTVVASTFAASLCHILGSDPSLAGAAFATIVTGVLKAAPIIQDTVRSATEWGARTYKVLRHTIGFWVKHLAGAVLRALLAVGVEIICMFTSLGVLGFGGLLGAAATQQAAAIRHINTENVLRFLTSFGKDNIMQTAMVYKDFLAAMLVKKISTEMLERVSKALVRILNDRGRGLSPWLDTMLPATEEMKKALKAGAAEEAAKIVLNTKAQQLRHEAELLSTRVFFYEAFALVAIALGQSHGAVKDALGV